MGCDGLVQLESKDKMRISIHAARMGCDDIAIVRRQDDVISIHAARMGCDDVKVIFPLVAEDFNPRSPNGLRQNSEGKTLGEGYISIHAARMGCDAPSQ